jgi:hypothetical protein
VGMVFSLQNLLQQCIRLVIAILELSNRYNRYIKFIITQIVNKFLQIVLN